MTTHKAMFLLGMLTLASCGSLPIPLNAAQPTSSLSAQSASLPPRLLTDFGLYELQVTGASTGTPTAAVISVSKEAGLSFEPLTSSAFTDPATGHRYLRVSMRVTNQTGQTLSLPTYLPVNTSGQRGTNGNTPFRAIKDSDGRDAPEQAQRLQLDTARLAENGELEPAATPLVGKLATRSLNIPAPGGTAKVLATQQGWQSKALPAAAQQVVTFALRWPQNEAHALSSFNGSVRLSFCGTDESRGA